MFILLDQVCRFILFFKWFEGYAHIDVAYIFVTVDDVTSPGTRVMVGNGLAPPVQDQGVPLAAS